MQTIYILPKSKQTNKNKNKKALHTANLEKKNTWIVFLTFLHCFEFGQICLQI